MFSKQTIGMGYRWIVSIFIVFVFAMQTYMTLIPEGDSFWPFLDYPMFQQKHREGDRLVGLSVYATLADGREIKISSDDSGTTYFQFQAHVAGALIHGREHSWKPLIKQFEKRHDIKIVRLRVENYPMVITREGGRAAPSEVLKIVELAPEIE